MGKKYAIFTGKKENDYCLAVFNSIHEAKQGYWYPQFLEFPKRTILVCTDKQKVGEKILH